jgi:WD40 repeat protein
LPSDCTALDWSNDGKWICCGDRDGQISILNAEDLKIVATHECQNKPKSKVAGKKLLEGQWVEICRFSPNGKYIAFGHHGYGTFLELIEIDPKSGKVVGACQNGNSN